MAERGLIRRALTRLIPRSIESGEPGVEGQPKPGPWHILGQGWLPEPWGYLNFWQMDLDPIGGAPSAPIVEACIAAYAQTIAMCPGDHWRALDNGGRERVTTSALSRFLKKPNEYQSRSDFILSLASDLYRSGNTYALAERNDRFEVVALHPFNPARSKPKIVNGNVFYELSGNDVIEPDRGLFAALRSGTTITAPARDVFHVKLEPEAGKPLVGIPPARHAAISVAAQRAIGAQLIATFGNLNRPAGVIETEASMTAPQLVELRKRFSEAWNGIDNLDGGPPILTNGFKFKPVSMSAKDAALAEVAKLTQNEIFMAFGVPPAILGMAEGASFASVEALMQFWLARGLGFAINHIEVAFDHFFGLRGWPEEWVEFDTRALLRVAFKERIDALARGVQGGIYSPNEARNAEDLPDAKFGDEPRVQQQVVPLSAWDKAPPKTPAPEAPPAAPPADGEADPDGEEVEDGFTSGMFERAVDEHPQAA